jgi:hypothetical protein
VATYTVTTAADVVNAGDGVLSLREAVQQVNATEAADDIRFAAGLEGQTLTLTQGQLTLVDSDPESLFGRTTIDGDANDDGTRVTISGGGQSRVLEVQDGAYVGITGLAVTNGDVDSGSGAGILVGEQCSVSIEASQISNCAAGDASFDYSGGANQGGGVFVGIASYVSLNNCQINSNFSNTGGGVSIAEQGFLRVNNSYIHDNVTGSYDGASSGFTGGEASLISGLLRLPTPRSPGT